MPIDRITVFILLFVLLLLSAANAAESQFQSNIGFNAPQALSQLEEINRELATKVNYSELYEAVKTINVLKEHANQCISKGKSELQKIDGMLKNNSVLTVLKEEKDTRYQYLINQRSLNEKLTAECIFFDYRAQEVINEINTRMSKTRLSNLLTRTSPIWEKIDSQFFTLPLNEQTFYQYSGIQQLNSTHLVVLVSILLGGIVFVLVGINFISNNIKKTFFFKEVIPILQWPLSFLFPVLLANLYLHWVLAGVVPYPGVILLFNALFYYLLAIGLLRFVLLIGANYISYMTDSLRAVLLKRYTVLMTLLLCGAIGAILIRGQWVPPQLLELRITLFITLLSLAACWLGWLILRPPFFKTISSLKAKLAKILLAGMSLFTIVMAWLGYINFAIHFFPNVFASILLIWVTWKVTQLFGKVYFLLSAPEQPLSQKIHAWMGLKPHKKLIELFTIRMILNAGFILFMLFIFMKIWGVSQYYIDTGKALYFNGFTIADISIWPKRIVRGAILFCILIMLGRALSTYVARRSAFKGELYRQDTIATLITYIVFVIAVISGLLMAGVNFMSLAVIAGALSIGMGFGLQYLVSDFVSGIILLMRKPVTPGDLVIIDDTEGYIKKIRLLSTQITTLTHADVIIPNSSLINKSFTNYTYHNNKMCRMNSQIILDSNSDFELAKQLLLEVVKNNPNVIQEPPHQPVVLFELTPSPSILYVVIDLWYFIKNVDLKQVVSSEINYAIVKALKDHNLCPGQKEDSSNA
ncbi:potassium efflux system KefA [Legionella donaldsonii]|uniref:Potassium efflux system KefA n=1 Tax=Legionella donaldsonii TaxID=45060 RepID=A0A378IYU1_9GAMM|nr:mechanosensitive ion channel domain-containing protein [Legionella donaldsonii]STX40296.1 potassium efflux system KefA [Legionella donaldsonii]